MFDRLEAEGDEFHERVREAYHRFAEVEPERIHLIDATASVEEIHQLVIAIVSSKLR